MVRSFRPFTIRWLPVLLVIFQAPSIFALSEMQFTRQFVQALEKAQPGIKVKVHKPLELRIELNGNISSQYLYNAWKDYQAKKSTEAVFKIYVNAVLTASKQVSAAGNGTVGAIVPLLKNRAYIQELKRKVGGRELPFAHRRINHELYVLYAYDSGNTMMMVRRDELKKLGVRPGELAALAAANLMKILENVKVAVKPLGESVYQLLADDNYEASLMLVPQLWTRENFRVKGEIVVFPLSRNVVFVTGSKDKKGLKLVSKVFADGSARELPYAISERPFVYRQNRWQPFHMK